MKLPVRSGPLFFGAELLLRLCLALYVYSFGQFVFYNDVNVYFLRAQDIGLTNLPYVDFLWEYPPVAALPLGLVPATGRSHGLFFAVFVLAMVALEYGSLTLLRRLRPQHFGATTLFWTMAVLPLCAVGYFRLDFLAVFFAALALWAMETNRGFVVPAVVGFGAKLWPLVFGVAMVVRRQYRSAIYTGMGAVGLTAAWWAFSPDGFRTFLEFRQGDGFQIESIPGTFLLLAERPASIQFGALVVSDAGWEWVQRVLQVVFFGVPLIATFIGWKRNNVGKMVALLAALVCVCLLSTRLFSPQFLLWLAPFMVLLWPHYKVEGVIYLASSWITVLFIALYEHYVAGDDAVIWLAVVRNALLVVLAGLLFRAAFSARRGCAVDPSPSSHEPA